MEKQPNASPETTPASNGNSTPDELEQIRAQLTEEHEARGAAEVARDEAAAVTAERDARIAELEADLAQARATIDATSSDIETRTAAYQDAVALLKDALTSANPNVPPNLIRGETPEDLAASVESAKALVGQVRAQLEADRAAVRVPAGAPPAETPSLEGLSSREKIAAGIASSSK